MKKTLITALITLTACVTFAGRPDSVALTVATGALTTGTNTSTRIEGYVENIQISCSDGVSTGLCTVAYAPTVETTVAGVFLATNTVTAALLVKPRVDGTTNDGSANTSDPPERYFLQNNTVTFIVSGSPTNKTWTARIKFNDE